MRLFTLLTLLLTLAACSQSSTSNAPKDNTVMITNVRGNSGGTGVVLFSTPTRSVILTNRHVCGLAKTMTIVHSPLGGDNPVVSYRIYGKHDLCLITVFADLHAYADISETPPLPGDRIMVSGHPHLLPRSVVFGQINGRHVIPVMDGTRPCTDAEKSDPSFGMLCGFFGGMPTVHQYDAMSASSLISPGNSGSQVVNADNKIVGLVFAGQGDVGWSELVPHEYIVAFIDEVHKLPGVDEQYPDSNLPLIRE